MREGLVPTPRSRWHRRTVLGLLVGGLLALLPFDLTPWDLPPPARASDVALDLRAGADAGVWESEPTPTTPLTVTGLTWQGEAPEAAWVRTSGDGGTSWGQWAPVGLGEDHGPDPGSLEAIGTRPGGVSDPVWVGEQDTTQWRVHAPAASGFGARLVDTTTRDMSLAERIGLVWRSLTATAPAANAAPPEFPGAHSRGEWGGGACGPVEPTDYSRVQMMFVHHTATSGPYSAAQVPNLIYGICAFHTEGNGWNDIAYNVIIDEFGGIWEGRGGGLHLPVQPAATMGFNYVSNAVGLLGTYTASPPSAAQQESLVRFLDWKLGVHHIDDPAAIVHVVSAGSTKFPAGTEVSLNAISGHRDAGETTCPGDACYSLLGVWRGLVHPIFFPFTPHFDDDDLSPFELEINILYEVGLSAGCTTDGLKFCPLADVSRGAMAVFLTRALNLPIPPPGSVPDPFDDDDENPLEPFVNAIASVGITAGCGERAFCPDGDVSRGEMAVFLTRALGLEPDPFAADLFVDDDGTFYEPFVNVFALAGITAGCGNGNYCGEADLPREQMAVFLLRGFVDSGIYPPDPGPPCETTTTTTPATSTSLATTTSSSGASTSSSSSPSSSSSSMGTSSTSSSSTTPTTEPPSSTAEETSTSLESTTTTAAC